MQFTISGSSPRDLQMTDINGSVIATLGYPRWFSPSAELTLADGSVITISKKGNWRMDMQAANGNDVLYDVNFKWVMTIAITGRGRTYELKKTNFWRQEYTLVSDDGQVAASVKWFYSLFKMPRYRFEIETTDNDPVANDPVLLLTLVFCLNYMRAGAVAASV